MGRSVALIPNPYTPATIKDMKAAVAAEITAAVKAHGLACTDIARRYKSIRAADLQNILRGEHDVYGLNRLVAIAEAIGISFRLERAA